MGYNLLIINGIYPGCNRLTNHLLTSRDIQVVDRPLKITIVDTPWLSGEISEWVGGTVSNQSPLIIPHTI